MADFIKETKESLNAIRSTLEPENTGSTKTEDQTNKLVDSKPTLKSNAGSGGGSGASSLSPDALNISTDHPRYAELVLSAWARSMQKANEAADAARKKAAAYKAPNWIFHPTQSQNALAKNTAKAMLVAVQRKKKRDRKLNATAFPALKL